MVMCGGFDEKKEEVGLVGCRDDRCRGVKVCGHLNLDLKVRVNPETLERVAAFKYQRSCCAEGP